MMPVGAEQLFVVAELVAVEAEVGVMDYWWIRERVQHRVWQLHYCWHVFPQAVPQQATGVSPVAGVQQGAAVAEQPRAAVVGVPPYLEMMVQMQRIVTPFFEGGVGPEEADEWRLRLERNFRSIRCPVEYQVELDVHYLSGDAHLRSIVIFAIQAEQMIKRGCDIKIVARYTPQMCTFVETHICAFVLWTFVVETHICSVYLATISMSQSRFIICSA
ncbi:unnamed protein product [Microthlaspi erraticum]|uniref:Uncharacterized protein n=1 Tax=Microthlaspi erraticum TaxID=1685480 RepID=A0A6D2IKR0_9BRAS|nr:unnamed protein product [Microthlaspi erraticum]